MFQDDSTSTDTGKEESKGDLNGNGAKTQNLQGTAITDSKGTAGSTAGGVTIGTSSSTTATATGEKWVANDYKSGDIKGASYTVKSGDTLW